MSTENRIELTTEKKVRELRTSGALTFRQAPISGHSAMYLNGEFMAYVENKDVSDATTLEMEDFTWLSQTSA